MPLYLLLLIPILTLVAVLCCPRPTQVRVAAVFGGAAQLLACGYLAFRYTEARSLGETATFLFQEKRAWFRPLSINYQVGIDGMALAMIILTALVVLGAVLVSWTMEQMTKEFFALLILLSVGAYGFFISLDLFLLFFFLEVAVIPKFLLIGIWGSGKKTYSAMKLALMLMAGSALVFVGITALYYYTPVADGIPTFDLLQIASATIPVTIQQFIFPFVFIGFGVFAALFPFHTWVPDGHAGAPTAASMFLAGISMKLGGFGCLRVAVYLLPDAAGYYSPVIVVLATIAIIYGAFATMMQTDLKYINAYSSVSHCGFVLLGIGMLTETAISGAVMQMVSHGLMTALFFAAIGMIYSRTHTRLVVQLGGLMKVMPFISTIFVIAGLCSLGLPGFSGFVAEMTVFMGSWQRTETLYRVSTVLACASIVVTAVYILRAVGRVLMGPMNPGFDRLTDGHWYERIAALSLVAAILLVGLFPFLLRNLLSPATASIVARFNHLVN